MTENKRFKWEDVYKWGVPAFLEVMNGLHEKNKQLKQSYQVLADMCDEYKEIKDSLENENESLKKENERLKKEIEEHKAVINREWNKYLKKHEMI